MSDSKQSSDEFYIGYLDKAPEGVAGFLRLRVLLLLLVAALTAGLLTAAQSPFAVAFFDFGAPRAYEGVVRLAPHPMLEVPRPGSDSASRYLLVGFGKTGAEAEVDGLEGRRVQLEGTPIYRDGQTMLEIVPGTVTALDGTAPADTAQRAVSLGEITVEGEIVDSKCHLGVMKPGETKPHRACAALCIRGGIPPILLVRGEELEAGAAAPVTQLLLVGAGGETLNDAVLEMVAEPVRITGELVRMGELYMLRASPSAIRRL